MFPTMIQSAEILGFLIYFALSSAVSPSNFPVILTSMVESFRSYLLLPNSSSFVKILSMFLFGLLAISKQMDFSPFLHWTTWVALGFSLTMAASYGCLAPLANPLHLVMSPIKDDLSRLNTSAFHECPPLEYMASSVLTLGSPRYFDRYSWEFRSGKNVPNRCLKLKTKT